MKEPIKWHLEKRRIDDILPMENNPRYISEHDIKHLKTSIAKFGLVDKPIINKNNTIIGGHQRTQLLKDMGLETIECWVPNRELSYEEQEELNIRLNRNHGSFDFDCLANVFNEEDLLEWGFTTTEFDMDEKSAFTLEEDSFLDECKKCPTCGKKLKSKK